MVTPLGGTPSSALAPGSLTSLSSKKAAMRAGPSVGRWSLRAATGHGGAAAAAERWEIESAYLALRYTVLDTGDRTVFVPNASLVTHTVTVHKGG